MPPASALNSTLLPVAFCGALIALLNEAPLAECQQIAYSLLPRRETACVPFDETWKDGSRFCQMTQRFTFLCAVAMMLTG
jgi:hypothetical protein